MMLLRSYMIINGRPKMFQMLKGFRVDETKVKFNTNNEEECRIYLSKLKFTDTNTYLPRRLTNEIPLTYQLFIPKKGEFVSVFPRDAKRLIDGGLIPESEIENSNPQTQASVNA